MATPAPTQLPEVVVIELLHWTSEHADRCSGKHIQVCSLHRRPRPEPGHVWAQALAPCGGEDQVLDGTRFCHEWEKHVQEKEAEPSGDGAECTPQRASGWQEAPAHPVRGVQIPPRCRVKLANKPQKQPGRLDWEADLLKLRIPQWDSRERLKFTAFRRQPSARTAVNKHPMSGEVVGGCRRGPGGASGSMRS